MTTDSELASYSDGTLVDPNGLAKKPQLVAVVISGREAVVGFWKYTAAPHKNYVDICYPMHVRLDVNKKLEKFDSVYDQLSNSDWIRISSFITIIYESDLSAEIRDMYKNYC
jgi:hypothetical protein